MCRYGVTSLLLSADSDCVVAVDQNGTCKLWNVRYVLLCVCLSERVRVAVCFCLYLSVRLTVCVCVCLYTLLEATILEVLLELYY
jgi:hypothetical protein